MYKNDFSDYLIPNAEGGAVAADTWCPSGTMSWQQTGPGSLDVNTNVALYENTIMAPYMSGQIGVYKCPCDTIAADEGARLRSYSMNSMVGCVYPADLNVVTNNNPGFRYYVKGSDITCPSPSDLFDFADENAMSINDGWLEVTSSPGGGFPDVPSARMGLACGFSFEDGHAEIHKWLTSTLTGLSGGALVPCTRRSKLLSITLLVTVPMWTGYGSSNMPLAGLVLSVYNRRSA